MGKQKIDYEEMARRLIVRCKKMNIQEIKMDHFESFDELIRTCKMWIRDDDIDAYYRFFEFNCMKALVTAYEKEKEKNKNAIDFINDKNNYFEDGENWQNVLKIKKILEE